MNSGIGIFESTANLVTGEIDPNSWAYVHMGRLSYTHPEYGHALETTMSMGLWGRGSVVGTRKGVAPVSNKQVGIHWGGDITKQGMPWENYVGRNLSADARLPQNFKTFDYYDASTKTAISAKTLDTQTASRLADTRQIFNTMKGYIDRAADFSRHTLSRKTLNADMIKQREIHLAIPAGTNAAQHQQLQRAVEYGRSRNVTIKITEIK